MGRKEASTVSSSRFIWLTDTPNIAGSISCTMRCTPSSPHRHCGVGSRCKRCKNGSWNNNCTQPAMSTPQASAIAGSAKYGAATTAAVIKQTLSNTGVNAGTAKRP